METVTEVTTSGLAVTQVNFKCEACGDIFPFVKQVRAHILRKHKNQARWSRTGEPANRKAPDWRARLAARAANKALVGPFKCSYCDHPPTASVKGVAAHIGHRHKKGEGPFVEGKDFTALGTGVPQQAKPKRKYTKRQAAGLKIKQALVGGKPTITVDIDLSDDIVIRVPITLGPPVFVENNGN